MSRICIIWWKEVRSYFTSTVGWVFIALFLFLSSFMFFVMPSLGGRSGFRGNFFMQGEASLTDYFGTFPIALAFFIPVLCIRLWPEEYRSGTIELLMTLPVRARDVVLGKFCAMITILAAAFVLTVSVPWSVASVAVDGIDDGPVWGGYVGAFLMGSAYCAVGLFVTTFAAEQVTGLLLALAVTLPLAFAGSPLVDLVTPVAMSEPLKFVGFSVRFESIEKGMLDFRDMAYFASITTVFLVLNVAVLEFRRLK